MADHYSTLQVTRDASPAVIHAAYRALARQHHPDHGGTDADMQLINEAYSVLNDPAKRRAYDHTLFIHRQEPPQKQEASRPRSRETSSSSAPPSGEAGQPSRGERVFLSGAAIRGRAINKPTFDNLLRWVGASDLTRDYGGVRGMFRCRDVIERMPPTQRFSAAAWVRYKTAMNAGSVTAAIAYCIGWSRIPDSWGRELTAALQRPQARAAGGGRSVPHWDAEAVRGDLLSLVAQLGAALQGPVSVTMSSEPIGAAYTGPARFTLTLTACPRQIRLQKIWLPTSHRGTDKGREVLAIIAALGTRHAIPRVCVEFRPGSEGFWAACGFQPDANESTWYRHC